MHKLDPKYLDLGKGMKLTDKQVEGVEFLINRSYGILAFQTGLGKTITSLVAMKILMDKFDNARCVILCPVKAIKIFKKELKTKLGYNDEDIGIISAQETGYDPNKNKIFLMTDSKFKDNVEIVEMFAMKYKLIMIADEAHKFQESGSSIYQAVQSVRAKFIVMWFATATPLLNDLDSLYNIVSLLDPHFLGGKTAFMKKYCKAKLKTIYVKGGKKRKVWDYYGFQNLDDLQKRLKDISIMRQIQYNLKFTHIVEELTDNEMATYMRVSKGIIGDEKKTFGARMHDLQRLVDNSYEDELIHETDGTKEKLLINSLKTIMGKGFATVVYADYLDTVDRLEYVLNESKEDIGFRNLFQIKGSIPFKKREQIEEDIGPRDIIIVTRAGTESINLQKANCIVMYDIPYSIKDCIQLIGRVTRMDTEHSHQYVILICTKGTIDEYKYLLFQKNSELMRTVMGSDANLPEPITALDKKAMDALKEKLLWHYKDTSKILENRNKRLLKNNIIILESDGYSLTPATHYFNLNNRTIFMPKCEEIDAIIPDEQDYLKFMKNELPLTVLKNRYYERLKDDKAKQVLGKIVNEIITNGSVVAFVDDWGVGKLLYDYILDNVKL